MTDIKLDDATLVFQPHRPQFDGEDPGTATFDVTRSSHGGEYPSGTFHTTTNIDREGARELYAALGEWLGEQDKDEHFEQLEDTIVKLGDAYMAMCELATELAAPVRDSARGDGPGDSAHPTDYPTYPYQPVREVKVGTTNHPAGYVYVTGYMSKQDGTDKVHTVVHYSPEAAYDLAHALRAAAGKAVVERACARFIPDYRA